MFKPDNKQGSQRGAKGKQECAGVDGALRAGIGVDRASFRTVPRSIAFDATVFQLADDES
jgi:hypothetical protein